MTSDSQVDVPWSSIAFGLVAFGCLFLVSASAVCAAEPFVDTDGDGISDRFETQVYHTDPLRADTDGDDFGDREEILHGYNPSGPGKLADSDYDGDGLNDRLELAFGANPMVPDTNGDGVSDGAQVIAATSPTSTTPVLLEKSIFISLARQQMEPRVNGIAIANYPVSSGLARTPTPVGTFKILQKNPRAWSHAAKLWMPYWMHFSGRGHGIHELPEWPNGHKEGESHLGHKASHGCVRLGVGTAKKIYDWAPVGTPVIISKL
jgi:hypothetical protein